jgi:DNA helicase-2/ATP-dependent DNA helicase PcrA
MSIRTQTRYSFIDRLDPQKSLRTICVVGDEDSVDLQVARRGHQQHPQLREAVFQHQNIRLEQNYRSTQTILDVAGAVVKNNLERKGKNLWTSNPRGGRVGYYQAFDAEAEARWVASKISSIARRVRHSRRGALSDQLAVACF